MGLFSELFKSPFDKWLENATDDELSEGYEERRQQWIKDGCGGNGERTYEMKEIDREMGRRAEKEWENNPNKNTDPDFRWSDEHRWE